VCWLALAMVLMQFAIVILRYVFGISYILQEGVLYMHAALFMLGAGYALLVDEHVRVDIFYARLSAPAGGDRPVRRARPAAALDAGDAVGHLAVRSPKLDLSRRPDLGRRHPGGVPAQVADPGLLRAADRAG
jgi:hypothetical protein